MVFSSTIFLFVFLPLVLVIYYQPWLRSRTFRNRFLLAASLLFYAWGEPIFVFLLIYTSVFSLILRFSQFFKTTRLPHAGILRHLVSEAAGRSDLRVQQTERRSLKFFEKAFCVPASPAVA